MDRHDERDRRPWMRLAGAGFELAAAVGGFTIVGHLIDRYRGSHPKGLLIGAILGLVGGMYNLIKASLAANRDAKAIDQAGAKATRTEGAKATLSDTAAGNDRRESQDGR